MGLLLMNTALFAQVPGYEGKRNPIHIEIHASPALADWVFQPDGMPELNLRIGLAYEHVISRRFSMGVNYSRAASKQNYLYQNVVGDLRLNYNAFGVYAKTYRFLSRGNIAPLGTYQKWELLYLGYRMEDPDGAFPEFGEERAFQDLAALLTIGTQRVFAGEFTWHVGITTGWVFNIPANRQETEVDQYLNQIAARRWRGTFALNLNAGVGILLF